MSLLSGTSLLGKWTPGWLSQFKAFATHSNVIDLAVGFIIGAAYTSIVNSLVENIFNPAIGGDRLPTLEASKAAGAVAMGFGLVINAIIKFLIVAFAVFWVVRALTRMNLRPDAEAKGAVVVPTLTELLLTETGECAPTVALTPLCLSSASPPPSSSG